MSKEPDGLGIDMILDRITSPSDVQNLNASELSQLSEEIRQTIISQVESGG